MKTDASVQDHCADLGTNHLPTASTGSIGGRGESYDSDSVPRISDPNLDSFKISGNERVQSNGSDSVPKLSRSKSFHEECCRVCQQQAEEALVHLGCHCRGGLAKAHRSCIDTWFSTIGRNKCEICKQVAINVPPPAFLPSKNYCVRENDARFTGSGTVLDRRRGWYSPIWVVLSILIGGLLLDVLVSMSLGVSTLPVNITIGALVVLGLGTAIRLPLECYHEVCFRRAVQRLQTNAIVSAF